jgi:hypothetical protein
MRRVAAGVFVAVLAGLFAPRASAAVLSGSLNTSPTSPIDLTAEGPRDWAVWNYQGSTINNTKIAPPSNRKADVTPVISSVTTLLGNARGTPNSLPTMKYSYSDGVSPTSLSNGVQGIVFDSTLNNTGSGITFNITSGAAGVPETVKLFLTGYGSQPTLTVSLPGADDYVNSDVTYPAIGRPVSVYTINFTPDHDGDLLSVNYQATTNSNANANVDLQAVAVAVPEPASLGIAVLGVGALLSRRSRRRI